VSEGDERNVPASPTPPTDAAPASTPSGGTRPQPTVTKRTTTPGKPQFGTRPSVVRNPVAKNPAVKNPVSSNPVAKTPVVRAQPSRPGSGPSGSAPSRPNPNGVPSNGISRPGPSTVNPANRPPGAPAPRPAAARPTSSEPAGPHRVHTSPEPAEGPRQRLTPPPGTAPAKPQPSSPIKNPAAAAGTAAPSATAVTAAAAATAPPAAPTPSRSWKDRLGLGKKNEPQADLTQAAAPAVPLTTSDPGRTGTSPATPAAKVETDRPTDPETTQPDPAAAPPKKVLGVPVPAMLRPGSVPKPAPAPVDTGGPHTEPLPAVAYAPVKPTAPAAHPEAAPKPKAGTARRTRKARLRLSQVDPWSVMKTSFLFSIAAGIMLVVAVYAFWSVLSSTQLFDSINEIVQNVVSTPGDSTPFRVQEYVNTQKVMGVAALIACVDVLIFTALATLGSFLYNLAATMLGGLEVTLAED
jgi:hypothetical protein